MGLKFVYCISVIFLISLWFFAEVLGGPCSQYKVDIKELRDCEHNKKYPYFHVINITGELKDDCKFVPRGCFRVKKGADADTVRFSYSGKFGKKNDEQDLCEGLKSDKMREGMKPYKDLDNMYCPLQDGIYCYRGGFNSVEQYKNYIGMAAGTHAITVEVFKKETPKILYCMKANVVISKSGLGFG